MDDIIDYIEKHNDDRGKLVVFLINSDLDRKYIKFVQIGPNVTHSFRSIIKKAYFLNHTNMELSTDDTFKEILMK